MTQAGNLYMFVMHNPVRWVDPTGLIAALPMGTGGIFGPIGPLAPGLTPRVNIPGNPGLAGGFNAGMPVVAFNPPSTITPEGGGHASRPTPAAATFLTDLDRLHGVSIVVTNGNMYRDVTVPVNAALAIITAEATDISRLNLLWFYRQVNHLAPWDIKRPIRWEETIGSTFPGTYINNRYATSFDTIYFRGQRMTPESLGNWTYGYIGAAQGIPLNVLVAGSWVAAEGPVSGDDWVNERGDWVYVQRGFYAWRRR